MPVRPRAKSVMAILPLLRFYVIGMERYVSTISLYLVMLNMLLPGVYSVMMRCRSPILIFRQVRLVRLATTMILVRLVCSFINYLPDVLPIRVLLSLLLMVIYAL